MAHINKILSFYQKHRRMPSYSEIMSLTGYRSKSAVHYFIDKLIEEGILMKDEKKRLILQKNYAGEVRVLGTVEAGFPSAAEEELIDTLSLDDYLIKNKEATYLLKVKGDSMIDAGIIEGDMVIVERGKSPRVGDIVIAEVDREFTMKYFRMKNGKPYLEPANPNYPPIYPANELKVIAIVKAVVRKY